MTHKVEHKSIVLRKNDDFSDLETRAHRTRSSNIAKHLFFDR